MTTALVFDKKELATQGELAARKYLESLPQTAVVGCNVRQGPLEVDLIARQANEVVFVEVKSTLVHSGYRAEERVNKGKQNRLFRAAEAYLRANHLENWPVRFDVVVVEFSNQDEYQVRHMIDAFRPETKVYD